MTEKTILGPIKVTELELTDEVGPIHGCAAYRELRALARHSGRPIGWVWCADLAGPTMSAEEVPERIGEQLGWRLVPLLLRERLGLRAPMAPPPPISVVVCTRDRPELLEQCLHALLGLDYFQYEVIVVDNAPSSNASAEIAERLPVRYVREDRAGLDWARNRGISEAQHDIIAFIDDDGRADRHWLRGIAQAFADPDVMATTGLVLPAELETPAQLYFELVYGGMSKGLTPARFRLETMQPRELITIYRVGLGANMAFRRSVFDRAGPFDTALDVGTPSGGGGDLDMFYRVLDVRMVLRYEPTAIVWHRHRREMAALRQQLYNDGRSFGVYLIKRWRSGRADRGALLRVALRWLAWLVGRLALGVLGRHRLPVSLLWTQLWGALHSPWAYVATYRRDRKIRAGAGVMCYRASPSSSDVSSCASGAKAGEFVT